MAVTFRSKSAVFNSNGTSPTATEPAGAASGDALLALYLTDAGGAPTLPAGWTSLYNGTQGAVTWRVGYIIRTGSAPSYAFTHTGNIYRELHVCCFQGSATVSLDSQSASGGTGTTTASAAHNPDPPATTAIAATSLAVAGGIAYAGSVAGWGASTGYAIRSDNTAGNDSFLESKSLAAPGVDNPSAVTGDAATNQDWWDGFTITFTDASGASPFVPGDYPNPRQPGRAIDLRGFVDPSENWLLKDTFFAAADMGPTYDWPNPRGKAFPLDGRTCVDPSEFWLLNDTFFGAPGQPPEQRDWPNPRGAARASDLRTFLNPSEFWLLKDTLFGAPGQVQEYDNPNPRAAQRSLELRTHLVNLLQSTLALPPSAAPFYVVDWPNPLGKRYAVDLRTFLDPSEFWLLRDKFFGPAGLGPTYDFPNPRGAVGSIELRTWIVNLQESTFDGFVPSPFDPDYWRGRPWRGHPKVAWPTDGALR